MLNPVPQICSRTYRLSILVRCQYLLKSPVSHSMKPDLQRGLIALKDKPVELFLAEIQVSVAIYIFVVFKECGISGCERTIHAYISAHSLHLSRLDFIRVSNAVIQLNIYRQLFDELEEFLIILPLSYQACFYRNYGSHSHREDLLVYIVSYHAAFFFKGIEVHYLVFRICVRLVLKDSRYYAILILLYAIEAEGYLNKLEGS